MIEFPYKRIWALIGEPRVGKDTVAKYLQESRNFATMAFADKIKEEYGIRKEDFESAKISGEISNIRKKLWEFSAIKQKDDPEYFIRLVIDEAIKLEKSIVITDIRTPEELQSVIDIDGMIYFVTKEGIWNSDEIGLWDPDVYLKESKIIVYEHIRPLILNGKAKIIKNYTDSSYKFIHKLEKFFFKEDLLDLCLFGDHNCLEDYIEQFDVIEKKHE